jgi:hypothetical protein
MEYLRRKASRIYHRCEGSGMEYYVPVMGKPAGISERAELNSRMVFKWSLDHFLIHANPTD